METVTRFAERQAGSVSVVSTPGPEVAHSLSVTASYLLSEDGRKASLLCGRRRPRRPADCAARAGQPTAPRLCRQARRRAAETQTAIRDETANAGSFALTPRPSTTRRRRSRNSIGPPRRITNWRAPTMPSASPSDRNASDADRALRESVAERFLADKEQRAVAHPPPSPKQCYVITDRGRLLFDVATDQGRREGRAARSAPALPSGSASQGRAQSAGPSGAARAARREEALHRRVGRGERHRRTEGSPGRRRAADGRSD